MKIVLQKELEMGGTRYKVGDEVDVSPEVYDWLVQNTITERVALKTLLVELEEKTFKKVRK